MQTVEYRLKSNSEKTVKVPKNYASRAESLIDLVLVGLDDISEAVFKQHPYLSNPAILHRTAHLSAIRAEDPISLKLRDEIYLRVCIYLYEKGIETGIERKEAIELYDFTIRTLEDLKQE